MKIEKEVLYHIFTKQSEFEYQLNYTYPIGNGPNYFWQGFSMCESRYNKEPYIGKYAAKLAAMHVCSPLLTNSECTKEVVKFLGNSVIEMGMLIRELIFEEYRRDNFTDLPSRQSAIFLIVNADLDFPLFTDEGFPLFR